MQSVNPVMMSGEVPAAGLAYRPGEQLPKGNSPHIDIRQGLDPSFLASVVPHELGHQLESLMVRTPKRAKEFMRILGMTPTSNTSGFIRSKWGLPATPSYLDKGGVMQNPVETYADIAGRQLGAPQYGYNTTPKLSPHLIGQLINAGLVPIRTPFTPSLPTPGYHAGDDTNSGA